MAEELTRETRFCDCRKCGTSALIRDWSCGCRTISVINDRQRCAECTDFSAMAYGCGETGPVRSHGLSRKERSAESPERPRETRQRPTQSYSDRGYGGGGGFSGGGTSSGAGGGLAGLALIFGIFVLFEDKPAPAPQPVHLPAGELIRTALDDPTYLSSIPRNSMTFAEYALAYSFVRYDSPRSRIAPGQPGIRWQVPLHAGPTTLSQKLGELSYSEEVTAHGYVKGPDGRTWEVVSRVDGSKGFALRHELGETSRMRASADSPPTQAANGDTQLSADRVRVRMLDDVSPPRKRRPYAEDLSAPFCSGDFEVSGGEHEILCGDEEALRLQAELVSVLEKRVAVQGEKRRSLIFSQLASKSALLSMCSAFEKDVRRCLVRDLRDTIRLNKDLLRKAEQEE